MNLFTYHDRLGFITPHYTYVDQHFRVESDFANTISQLQGPRQIDVNAIIQVISRYHCFADRTLVQGIYRTPWMAHPNSTNTEWEYANIPPHGNTLMPEEEAAKILFAKLQSEILEYCEGRSTVGVLLSGGMDSRIVAGILDHLLKTKQTSVRVIAITWGIEQTRDVLYAQLIAKRLGWEWVHHPISAETLANNIDECAQRGCEYSPVHLHAMPNVREMKGLDCILAASFGDSVGRAEYSGRHITKLIPFEHYTLNWFKLLHSDVYTAASADIAEDVNRYRRLFPRKLPSEQHEIDQQSHYMRRKLNHCMAVIHEKIPLFQVFTRPDVFGFMWSLSPEVRNDSIYAHLLELFSTKLSDIPWARDGKLYLSGSDKTIDAYPSANHRYGEWIRGDLYPIIRNKVLSGNLQRLQIFNMQAIESALALNRNLSRQTGATKLDELSVWLAALADFVDLYAIQGVESEQTLADYISALLVSPLQVAGLSAAKFLLSR